MTIQDLIVELTRREFISRPYRLDGETQEDYRKGLGAGAPVGPFGVDLAPDLGRFSEFVILLTKARLTNLDRDALGMLDVENLV